MALYNFKTRFVPLIRAGRKKQTIRGGRAPKTGDPLYLYTGMRHSGAKLIALKHCSRVEPISIRKLRSGTVSMRLGNVDLDRDGMKRLALLDGFKSLEEMLLFWDKIKLRMPFDGHVIYWE